MSFLFLLVLCTHANSACNRQWNFYTSMTLWVILQGDPAVRYSKANLCYSLIMTSKNRRKRTISVASRKLVYAQLLTGGLWIEFVKFFGCLVFFSRLSIPWEKRKSLSFKTSLKKVDGIVNVKGECLPLLTVTISRIV